MVPIFLYEVWGWSLVSICIVATIAIVSCFFVEALRSYIVPLACAIAVIIGCVRLSMPTTAPDLTHVLSPLVTFQNTLTDLRMKTSNQLGRILPEPQGAFMAGLLTGDTSGIPKDVILTMQRTGLTHILAISGFNITLVILLLEHLLFFLPRQWRLIPASTAVICFVLFVGGGGSVIRAAIMGILNLCALHVGRQTEARMMIGWTAVLMLLWSPDQLVEDVGFQLSFLAVIGLTECSPMLEPILKYVPQTLGIREALQATLAAELTASVWSAKVFGQLPLFSLIANILVAPFLPIAMLAGGLGLLGSFIAIPIGQLLVLPGWLALSTILIITRFISAPAWSVLEGVEIGNTTITIYYCGLISLVYRWQTRTEVTQPRAAVASPG